MLKDTHQRRVSLPPRARSGSAGLPSGLRLAIERNVQAARDGQLSLPFPNWVERLRAAPNGILRSALFGVIKRGRRKFVKEMPLPMVGELSLTYTGERLDQADLDVFLQIVHYARNRRASEVITFPTRRLLREIGRCTGKSDYEWLHGRLVALTACGIVIQDAAGRKLYAGALLLGAQDPTTDESAFLLNPYLRVLFDNFTLLDWDDRLALGAKQLVKWLHSFYATHAAPYPMKVETLMDLCGAESGTLKEFRRQLRTALEELRSRRLIRAWRIDNTDLVHVTVAPSASQARHLAKAAQQATG